MTKDEAIEVLRDVAKAALSHHGIVLMSDPPLDAWKHHRVSERLHDALVATATIAPTSEAVAASGTLDDRCKYPICDCDQDHSCDIPAAQPHAKLADGERAAFEAWAPEWFGKLKRCDEPGAEQEYMYSQAQAAWLAWQARGQQAGGAEGDAKGNAE